MAKKDIINVILGKPKHFLGNFKFVLRINNNRKLRISIIYFALVIICISFFFIGYSVIYSNKTYPRLKVAGISVGGQSENELDKSLLILKDKVKDKKIEIVYQNKSWKIKPEELKISYNKSSTIDHVMLVGREKSVSERFWSRLRVLFTNIELNPIYDFDGDSLAKATDRIIKEVNVPAKDARAVINGQNVDFAKQVDGIEVDVEKLKDLIIVAIHEKQPKVIKVPVRITKPKIYADQTDIAKEEAENMLSASIDLKWPEGTSHIGATEVKNLLKFEDNREGTKYVLHSKVDDDKLKKFVSGLGKNINKAAVNAKLTITNGQVTVLENGQDGYEFDQAQTLVMVKDSILAGETKEIILPVSTVKPAVSQDNLPQVGIKEIIGSATTNFSGSPDSRKQNISNGARILNNVLIKPGEEFSIVKALGNVDASTGYVLGLVFKGSEIASEYGGGLCQVSSTLFRAALNTGLRISERANHRYRVFYYEKDGDGKYIGPGLDATIYGPHPDLRFVNDTEKYILLQTKVEGVKITFELWGTKDGRVATIDGPHVSDIIPAPPTEYVNTDTLYVGEKKLLEGSMPGATAVVNYKVVKDGKEITTQTFRSKYKPLGAKYQVGTKPR